MRTPILALGLIAAGALALAGCNDEEASKPKSLAVSFDQAGKVTAPASIEGGQVTLRFTNNAKAPAGLQMIRVTGSQTGDDILKVIQTDGGPIPTWMADGGGIGTIKPGATETTTQELPAGRWILLPQSEDDRAKPQTPVLQVNAGEGGGDLPETSAKIDAFEYGFKPANLKAGRNTLEFANIGKQLHHVEAFPVLPGKTLAEVKRSFQTERGEPAVDFRNGTGTTVIDGGQRQVVSMNLKGGRNVLVCFIQDRKGGPPHVAKGMITEVNVAS